MLPSPEVARLAFEAATRRVEGQESSLNSLRSQASSLLGSSAIATSFFAGFTLTDRTAPLTVFAWIGFSCAALLALLTAYILFPRAGWKFGHDPELLIRSYYEGDYPGSSGPLTIEECHRHLAEHIGTWVASNKAKLRTMYRVFAWAVIVVGILVVAWLTDLVIVKT